VDAVLVTTAVLLLLAAAWSMLLAVRRRWPAGWLSGPLEHGTQSCYASNEGQDDDYGRGEGGAGVREPRRPLPSSGGAAAYVDPDERAA
jgi:hypothetical protein